MKPNAAQVPSTFDAGLVLHQLRCCGVLEVTRIARAGYPTRYLHQEFADRYGILLTPKARGVQLNWPVAQVPCDITRALLCAFVRVDILQKFADRYGILLVRKTRGVHEPKVAEACRAWAICGHESPAVCTPENVYLDNILGCHCKQKPAVSFFARACIVALQILSGRHW